MVESNILEAYFLRCRAVAEKNIKKFQPNLKAQIKNRLTCTQRMTIFYK
jgi:hypothetical protein